MHRTLIIAAIAGIVCLTGVAGRGVVERQACGGEIIATGGEAIKSPNHPNAYPDNQDCEWVIRFPPGNTIRIEFGQFDLEFNANCIWDWLEVRNGNNENSPMIGSKLCGDTVPAPIESTGNEIFVRFHSDHSVTRPGFTASFSAGNTDFELVDGRWCDPTSSMSSKNLEDAKKECTGNPSCTMFFDWCGNGDEFKSGTSSSEIKQSSCNSILHKKQDSDQEPGYNLFKELGCPKRNEEGVFEGQTRDGCRSKCDVNSNCIAFEWYGESNPHQTKGSGFCKLSSSCTHALSLVITDTNDPDWLYVKVGVAPPATPEPEPAPAPPTLAEFNAAKNRLRGELATGRGIPLSVRLAFHDCVGPNGCDGCVNLQNPDNDGLSGIIDRLATLRSNEFPTMSNADFWQIAGIAAVEMSSSDQLRIDFKGGRPDCATSPSTTEIHEFPEPSMSRAEMMGWFKINPSGFDMDENMVTALMGAHNLGGAVPQNSGYKGLWTPDIPEVFDNHFYQRLNDATGWHFKNKAIAPNDLTDKKFQWDVFFGSPNGRFSQADEEVTFMLNTDMELVFDIDVSKTDGTQCFPCNNSCDLVTDFDEAQQCPDAPTKTLVEQYAGNQQQFFDDFKLAFEKMMNEKIGAPLIAI